MYINYLSFPRPHFENIKLSTSSSFSSSVRCLSIDRTARSLSRVWVIDVRRSVFRSFSSEKDLSHEAMDTAVVNMILVAVITFGKVLGPYLIAASINSSTDPQLNSWMSSAERRTG